MDTISDCGDCHIKNTLHSDFSMKFSVQFLRLPHSVAYMAFIPHTKRSLNIESKESPYSQYWLSLLSSAMYCDTLSPLFLLRMLNWDLSTIRFLFGFSWFVIKVTNSSNNFYKGFAGAISPLNNRYVYTPQDFKRKALFFAHRQYRLL